MTNLTYRQLAGVALVLLSIANLIFGLVLLDPFFLVRFVVGLVLTALVLRFDRWWAVVPALIVGIAMLAELVFFIDALTRFDTAEFGFGWANIVLGVGLIIFAIADLVARRRRANKEPVPRTVVQIASAATAILIAAAVASAITTIVGRDTVSAGDREGALVLTYEDIELEQKELTAKAGEPVRIVVDNKDIAFHDFDLEAADVHVELSSKESKLVEFTIAEPGEYEYKCTVPGHDKMKGTLTVE